MNRIVAVALPAIVAVACTPAPMKLPKLPSGPGESSPDAQAALAEATRDCRAVTSYSAEVAITGSIGGHRVRGRLLTGLAAPSSARIEAVTPFGPPLFILVARDEEATLLLPREERVLEHGPPAAVLQALAGVPLDAAELRTTMTACAAAPDTGTGRRIGEDWRVVRDGPTEIFLHRETSAGRWQIVAAVHHPSGRPEPDGGPDWRAEYRDFRDGLPRAVRLMSGDGKQFDLRLSLSQVEVNAPLNPAVFAVQIPRSAQPITLDELRNARPGFRQD
jgi:outer membrane lipoprotein-sorting protein